MSSLKSPIGSKKCTNLKISKNLVDLSIVSVLYWPISKLKEAESHLQEVS